MRLMELRHLQSFVAVAEELHFSRAAERLQIAQSPLSQRIRALEGELGVQLFERTNRRVALTEAGAAMLLDARAALAAADGARRAAVRARDGETGTLRFGFVASAAFLQLPALLRALYFEVPDVRVELHRLDSVAQVEALAARRIDVGLARTPPADKGRLGVLELAPEPLLVALPADHPRAGARSMPLAALAGEPWVLSGAPASPSDLIVRILQACARAGFAPTVAHESPDLPSVLGLVAAGLGVSLVPLGIARLRVAGTTTVALAADDRTMLPSTLLWQPDRPSAVAARLVFVAQSARGHGFAASPGS